MKKNLLFFLLYFIFSTYNLFGYDWLYVQDPQNTWRGGPGTIDKATYSIHPMGAYVEYGVYLTFSAKNLGFTNSDTLEVQYYFDLPEGAIVNDLWLWVGDDIMKAIMLDQWTASTIYENIVKRRRDPAILFKRSNTSYELRIFPMAGNESRRIKLTFLLPVSYSSTTVSTIVPTNLIWNSYEQLDRFDLLFNKSTEWGNPALASDYSELEFNAIDDTTFINYMGTSVPFNPNKLNININYENLNNDKVFLSALDSGGEGYYQIAMTPKDVLEVEVSKKAVILLDYDASKSDITFENVLNNLKSTVKANMSERDSLNIIFSNLNILRVSENWISADSATIEAIFDTLSPQLVSNYSNLPSLLNNGIEFLNDNGGGNIILISNSDQSGDFTVANQLINDLRAKMDETYPFYSVDYTQRSNNYYYQGGRYYYANEYFYTNLSRLTGGEYQNVRNGKDIIQIMSDAMLALDGLITSFDFYTTVESGFCFGRYNINNSNSVYINKPLVQVGKFYGDFPFKVTLSGIYKGESFSKNFIIDSEQIYKSDTSLSAIWTGNYIASLENQPQTNSIISEIVDYSISERVLSAFTAFLALEPNDTILACLSCVDEGDIPISVEDEIILPEDFLIEAYPNPFNNQVTLNVKIPSDQNNEEVKFQIFNILGEVVKTFQAFNSNGNYEFKWDGLNDYGSSVSSGIYLFVVKTNKNTYSHKIILMK